MENKKTLIFEGAGWEKSESSGDVGNCRIGATFVNDKGQELYIELNGTTTTKYSIESMKRFTIGGWIAHLHLVGDKYEEHVPLEYRGLAREYNFEWNKENILRLINEKLNCSFDAIEVRNKGWDRFKGQNQIGEQD